MKAIDEILDELEEYIEQAKNLPFSAKISVDKETVLSLINELRLNLPNEILQAKRIIGDYDRIIKEAEIKASDLIKNAYAQSGEMIGEHEIYIKAVAKANELMEEAKQSARDVRKNAIIYADELISRLETVLKEAMITYQKQSRMAEDCFSQLLNTLSKNRRELKNENGD